MYFCVDQSSQQMSYLCCLKIVIDFTNFGALLHYLIDNLFAIETDICVDNQS